MKYSKSNSAKTKERDMRRKPTENFASLPKYLVIETQTGQSKSM
jgi:hypothetical protein